MKLKKITEETVQLLRKWRNQNRTHFIMQKLINEHEQELWYQRYLEDQKLWVWIVYKDEEPIGSVGLSYIDHEEAQIELLMLGEKKYEHKGFMSDALQIAMKVFPFKKYRLMVRKDNGAAIAFYKKNGFTIVKEENGCYIMKIVY